MPKIVIKSIVIRKKPIHVFINRKPQLHDENNRRSEQIPMLFKENCNRDNFR